MARLICILHIKCLMVFLKKSFLVLTACQFEDFVFGLFIIILSYKYCQHTVHTYKGLSKRSNSTEMSSAAQSLVQLYIYYLPLSPFPHRWNGTEIYNPFFLEHFNICGQRFIILDLYSIEEALVQMFFYIYLLELKTDLIID